ncbi:unnamed protein product [Paramecium sonneborni]|uniref:Transmembrane protein n=1 Tax=Paramecium sonneborni TaxID=65129 RepID=A0A8S1RF35_9CILI|nr:unnamed protein product [Paramecium sonneborni]
MKITSKTFDIFGWIIQFMYECLKNEKKKDSLTQQELLDYDFVSGQVGKVILFWIQTVYFLDVNFLYKLETVLLIIGYYFFVAFMVLVEQKYVYDGYSYTFHRIITNRFMNLIVNGISILIFHQKQSLLITWENIKKKQIEFDDFVVAALVISTGFDIIQILFQLSTVTFSGMKEVDKTENFYSKGGCIQLCIGQFIGIVLLGGSILIILLDLRIIILEGSVGLEFLLSCIYYSCNDKGKEDAPKSKKILCFGYGFCIGAMGIISGPAILIILFFYALLRCTCCCYRFSCKCLICCWCAKVDQSLQYQFENLNTNEIQAIKKEKN